MTSTPTGGLASQRALQLCQLSTLPGACELHRSIDHAEFWTWFGSMPEGLALTVTMDFLPAEVSSMVG
jgi:hypothetical protein